MKKLLITCILGVILITALINSQVVEKTAPAFDAQSSINVM